MVQWVTYLPGKHKDVNLNPSTFTKSGKHWEADMWVPQGCYSVRTAETSFEFSERPRFQYQDEE